MASISTVVSELEVLGHGLWTASTGDRESILALPNSAPSLFRDAGVSVVFTFGFLVLNLSMRKILIEPILTKVMGLSNDMQAKVTQSIWSMTTHGGFSILGVIVVPNQVWIWPSTAWWVGFDKGGFEIMRSDLRCFYLLYAARYLYSCFSTWFEHKRKDFKETQIHHWTTVVLIFISYAYGWNRVGSVIMILLDPTDALLQAAKMCKYVSESLGGDKKNAAVKFWQRGADVIFATFAVIFIITRLMMYPYVCWSAQVEAHRYFPFGAAELTCLVLLYTLLGLQIFWFYQLVRAVYNMFKKGGIEDVRSDIDSDTDVDMDAVDPKKTN